MPKLRTMRVLEIYFLGLALILLNLGESYAQQISDQSESVIGTCTGSPCPWGPSLSGQAIVWPADLAPLTSRLGYTLSAGIYLPSANANGAIVRVHSGTATAFAGLLNASTHRVLRVIAAGEAYTVGGLAPGEVLSVSASSGFFYEFTPATPVVPDDDWIVATLVTGACTGSPCPWGPSVSGQAIVWPADLAPLTSRLGYTLSAGIYLPAANANGVILRVYSGTATAFAGLPGASTHRVLRTLAAGEAYTVGGLAPGEVLSVTATSGFYYGFTPAAPVVPDDDWIASTFVTGACTSSPCPWGSSLSGQAIVWPADLLPLTSRLGYTLSEGIYLPSSNANGAILRVHSGTATAFAGSPTASTHRVLRTLAAGEAYTVGGLAPGEVLSVTATNAFYYDFTPPAPVVPPISPGNIVDLVDAVWRCNLLNCTDQDWIGGAVSWPSWSAYQTNGRSGSQSRSAYTPSGEPLYPYMGSWANGCEVTVVAGDVLIIEWERGTSVWRETWLWPGETHVIALFSPENGALIEGIPGSRVLLNNCDPQPLL